MIDIILLIVLLTITILYGYHQFSNNISDILLFKEGFIAAPTMPVVDVQLPSITNTNFATLTEGKFIDFIIGMYTIISTGVQNSQDISPTIINPIDNNVKSMILISNYSPILKGINQSTFNSLTTSFPNMIQSLYDVQALNELYYSSISLNNYISKLNHNTNLTDPLYADIYNSLLGYFNTYYNSINYFYNIRINPESRLNIGSEDDYNSTLYYINQSTISSETLNPISESPSPISQNINTTVGPTQNINTTVGPTQNMKPTVGPTQNMKPTVGPTVGPTAGPTALPIAYNNSVNRGKRFLPST